MSWNYRMVRTHRGGSAVLIVEIGLHEVFYDLDEIIGWTIAPASPSGGTWAILQADLARFFKAAIAGPSAVLDEVDMPDAGMPAGGRAEHKEVMD